MFCQLLGGENGVCNVHYLQNTGKSEEDLLSYPEVVIKLNSYLVKYIENNTWARMDMEFLFDLNTRREISYLQATMYNFVYRINTLVFY